MPKHYHKIRRDSLEHFKSCKHSSQSKFFTIPSGSSQSSALVTEQKLHFSCLPPPIGIFQRQGFGEKRKEIFNSKAAQSGRMAGSCQKTQRKTQAPSTRPVQGCTQSSFSHLKKKKNIYIYIYTYTHTHTHTHTHIILLVLQMAAEQSSMWLGLFQIAIWL